MKKYVVVGIILLFIVSSVTPMVIGNTSDEKVEDEYFENIAYVNNDENTIDGQQIAIEGSSTSQGDDVDWWPMFQHDLNRSGYSTSSGPLTNNVLWGCQLDGSIYPTPVVVDDKMYVGGERKSESIHCLNADTGEEIWKTHIPDGTRCSPTVVDERVYVGSDENNGNFYCLDANNGSIIWQYYTGCTQSSPLIFNNRVYVCTWNGDMYCLNASTGDEIWMNELIGDLQTPAYSNGKIYTSSAHSVWDPNYVYCINAYNGEIIWTFQSSTIFRSPAIYNGNIYIGDWDGVFYCLDMNDGSLIWSYQSHGHISTAPCIFNNKVYFADRTYYLYCLNASSGEQIWEFRFPVGYEIFVSPIVVDDMIYIGHSGDFVFCINASSGEQIWNYETVDHMRASFAIADGKLYCCTCSGWIFCFYGQSENNPPNTPQTPEGPTNLSINNVYMFNSSSFDIDGDQLYYRWKWAEGDTGWLGPYNSNETTTANVTFWQATGNLEIKVIARDSNFATSEWATLEVTVPVNQQSYSFPLLQQLLERFPNMFPILRNLLE